MATQDWDILEAGGRSTECLSGDVVVIGPFLQKTDLTISARHRAHQEKEGTHAWIKVLADGGVIGEGEDSNFGNCDIQINKTAQIAPLTSVSFAVIGGNTHAKLDELSLKVCAKRAQT